ncbi:MAG: hypothetical protein LKJ88_06440 [Bacilli bacterium]|jgi:alpha-L-arabinofuranosidase|nr:hypothetical protein [Bacilli bacterium]
MAKLHIDEEQQLFPIPKTLYGLFLEDINFTLDGGLNANMIFNPSFDCVFRKKGLLAFLKGFSVNRPVMGIHDGLRGYRVKGKAFEEENKELGGYSLLLKKDSSLFNDGYTFTEKKKAKPSMAIKVGHDYLFSFYGKTLKETIVTISVQGENSSPLLSGEIKIQGPWTKYSLLLKGIKTGLGTLKISVSEDVELDSLSLIDDDCWHKEDPKYEKSGKFRKDLVEALVDLHPGIVRFPGGTITDGIRQNEEYRWKDTVGPLEQRHPSLNLMWDRGKNYTQSYSIGFYELFCLCEDLHAEPLPVIFSGQCFFNTLFGGKTGLDPESKEFDERVIQNALDLISFANGDPSKEKWAKIRADSGHPAPFNLKYLSIGNENSGEFYCRSFKKAYDRIHALHPEIKLILSSGIKGPDSPDEKYSWEQAEKNDWDVFIDEHYYQTTDWCFLNSDRYLNRPNKKQKIFIGEYSARGDKKCAPNRYLSAVAEGSMMIGYEKGADKVMITCFAPLFNNVSGTAWLHNLIDFNAFRYIKNPNYLAESLFASNVGQNAIKAWFETEEKDLKISATEDDSFIYLKLVNAGEEKKEIKIACTHMVKSPAQLFTLVSASLDGRNTLTPEDKETSEVKIEEQVVEAKEDNLTFTAPAKSLFVIKIKRA